MCLLIADNKLVITVASQYDIDFMKEQSIKADIDINNSNFLLYFYLI